MTDRWAGWVGAALWALTIMVGCGHVAEVPAKSPDGGSAVDSGGAVDAVVDAVTDPGPGAPDATVEDTGGAPDVATVTPDVSPVDTIHPPDTTEPTDPTAFDCDPLMEAACALPWPSNLYLARDPTRGTGYTLAFGETTLPVNVDGKHIDPTPYGRMDGYGVESPLLVLFPNLDTTGFATEYHTDPSLEADAKVVWLAIHEGGVTRVPYWAELDAVETDPDKQVLFVRPAVILEEGTRYVVAFRGLKTTDGATIAPSPAFVALRDGKTAGDPLLAPRQARFDDIFAILESEGIARDSLTLAWDFVTASTDGLHSRMLHMRDDALATVGPDGPEITIDEVKDFTPEENADIAVEMTGTFHMPSYLNPVQVDGVDVAYVFNEGPDGMPAQSGFTDEKLWIRIPRSALDGTPHGLVQYGHGQNGQGDQVRGSFNSKIANKHDLIFFACNMLGMSEEDVPNIVAALLDLSGFVRTADRLHQGMVNQVLLARAMRERFPKLPEVTSRGIVVNPDELFYSGISQGGIYGATYMAVSQDVTRGHLGVPGNNYSFLLLRSGNFKPFFAAIMVRYPERASQLLALTAVQLLWDGVDPVSYMRRITDDPFPGNEPHHIILAPAKGDPQVPVTSNEWVGRSDIGIPIMEHYDTERVVSGMVEQPYPYVGSGIVLYAFGNPWPTENIDMPPDESLPDPHEKPRKLDHHNEQMVHFFRTGEIIDVCGGDGCTPE